MTTQAGREGKLGTWMPTGLSRRVAATLLGFASLTAPAQAGGRELRFDQVDRISIEEGLSHSSVWAIRQDARGFLWLGTQEGLNRYDGYGFQIFKNDPEDPDSLSGNQISEIYEDRRGDLWVGTLGGGLNRFLPAEEHFEHFRHDGADATSLSHDVVWRVYEDRAGSLWVGTLAGLDRLDREAGTFSRYHHDPEDPASLSGQRVSAILEDRQGRLWVGTDRGLNRFDPQSGAFEHFRHDPTDDRSLSHDAILALQEDPDGRLWVGTESGLNSFDADTGRFDRYLHDPADPRSLSHDEVFSLLVDRSGELWVGTPPGGLNRLDRTTGKFFRYRHDPRNPQSLSSDTVFYIYEDTSGLLWFGTLAGVNKYERRREQFTTYRRRPGPEPTLSGNRIWPILEDRAGDLWVGTFENGLNRFDGAATGRERRPIVHYRPDPSDAGSLPHGTVASLYEDRSGTLWVGTLGGLSRFDPDSSAGGIPEGGSSADGSSGAGRFVHYRHNPEDPESLTSDWILSLHEDRSGRFWVGTDKGLNRLERDSGRSVRYLAADAADLPAAENLYAICEDRGGSLWFGSQNGLYRVATGQLDGQSFVLYRHDSDDPSSLSSDKIASLYADRTGALWVGTFSAGLNRMQGSGRAHTRPGDEHEASVSFDHFGEGDGLADATVLGILEDDTGRLWLSTHKGLSRFDPRTESFENFDIDDGLQGSAFSIGSAFRSSGGEMFFGGLSGFNAFWPQQITRDPQPPPVVITNLFLFNEPLEHSILHTRELELSYRQSMLSFEFAALHYASPHKNRYAYRLEGIDRDWIMTDAGKRFAQYSNLDPGHYVFRVRGANGHGVWNDDEAVIKIVVKPPPWKTWWAYTLYFLGLSAVVLGYVRAQARKVDRQRSIARHERAISAQLREVAELKDDLLEERAAELDERERLIAELEASNAELSLYNYTISHDLKNPLVTIKSFLGLLRRDIAGGDTDRVEHDLERIGAAAEKMRRLLDELLELSRIGRVTNPPQEVALSQLASEAVESLSEEIARRGVTVDIAPGLPVVRGDRPRLLEVVQNLLENAVRYAGDGEEPRVEVGVLDDGSGHGADAPVFYVRDNGIGIDPRYHEKIFGLFERLEQEEEGTGIGLALVRRIIQVHGGRIWVESAGLGYGSTFCVALPGSRRPQAAERRKAS